MKTGGIQMKEKLIDRLTSYVVIDTQSDASSTTTPSTDKQWNLLNQLKQEIEQLGLETDIDEYGYLFATLPSNTNKDVPVIGLLAHVDTATDFTGTNVNPQIIQSYDGNDITLKSGLKIETAKFPELSLQRTHINYD